MSEIKFLSFVLFLTLLQVTKSLENCEKDDPCVTSNGEEGTVTLALNCKYFKSLSKRDRKKIRICGFEELEPKICCPQMTTTTEKISTTTENIIIDAKSACQRFQEKPKDSEETIIRIINGTHSAVGEFPHFASLGYQQENDNAILFQCGGALISANFVLTAAHCCKNTVRPVVVRLGKTSLDPSDTNDPNQHLDVDVKEIHNHPQYRTRAKYHDISLVELAESVSFTEFIWPACLQLEDNFVEKELIIAGFGRNDVKDKRMRSIWLMKAGVVEIPLEECRYNYTTVYGQTGVKGLSAGITDDIVCAKNRKFKVDSCEGDSGSALQYFDDDSDSYYIVGLVSFGVSCNTDLPSFYTRVPSYLDWIESVVWNKE